MDNTHDANPIVPLGLSAPKQAKAFGGDVTSLASGQHHTIVTKTDGTVWTIGRGDAGQLGVLAPESSSAPSETKHLLQVQGIDGDVVGISACVLSHCLNMLRRVSVLPL